MSTRPVDAPPAGEHIHLPGPSYQPIIVTLGLTGMLIGILEFPLFGVFSGIVMLVAIISWIRSAVREYRELPLTHD
jgi:hypothetical protein